MISFHKVLSVIINEMICVFSHANDKILNFTFQQYKPWFIWYFRTVHMMDDEPK